MSGPFATRLFRVTLALAGGYNVAFGIWAALWPTHFFELARIEAPRYPQIWACVGMVVGLYGLLYWYAAWKPELGRPIVAIGLLGKILGPIGMVVTFSETWPPRVAMLSVYNDAIWWLPFALFLLRGTTLARKLGSASPWICAGVHGAALAVLGLILRHGLASEGRVLERARFIVEHGVAWAAGWGVWMLAGLSLLGFYAWWAGQLERRDFATLAVLLAAAGVVLDLSGEALSMLMPWELGPPPAGEAAGGAWSAVAFERVEGQATLLTAGAANGVYSLAGLILMLITPDLPRWVRMTMWGTWLAGAMMTLAAVAASARGMMVTTAVLFPLLIVWLVWMGARWRRQ